MLSLLARLCFGHSRLIALLTLAVFIGSVVGSVGVQERLSATGLDDPGSEAAAVDAALRRTFEAAEPGLLMVVGSPEVPVTDEGMAALIAEVKKDASVLRVRSPLGDELGSEKLRSADGKRALVIVEFDGDAVGRQNAWKRLRPVVEGASLPVMSGGPAPAEQVAQDTAMADLVRAELLALPPAALLLLWFFRGPWAAMLPLLTAGVAVPLTIAMLGLVARFTEVSVFALNVASFIGLGLAVDYALVLVTRFREERAHGKDVEAALHATLSTTGRAVLISGVTVAASMAALFVFPLGILQSIALAGMLVVLATLIASLALLPSMFVLLGDRLGAAAPSADLGAWHRLGQAVVRRPVPIALGVIFILGLLAAPVLRLKTVMPDARSFPADTDIRRVDAVLEDVNGFAAADATPILALVKTGGNLLLPQHAEEAAAWCRAAAALPGVASVDSPFCRGPLADPRQQKVFLSSPQLWNTTLRLAVRDTTRGDTALILIRPSESWRTDAAADLVRALRDVESAGVEALVGGPTAAIVDSRAAMGDGLVLAVSLVVGINLFLLFMAFGSIVVPIKAVVMNVASVAASFGALVWVFQDGHFASALGFEVPGGIDLTVPIILFSVVFGLSMDYEVFLLARIREEYLRTGDDHEAIALGLERTGSLITRAALLLVVVVVGFAAGEFLFVQELGVGMVLAILLDATLVRALLVPSTMAMLGHWNWWAPAPLARLWVRMGGRVVGH